MQVEVTQEKSWQRRMQIEVPADQVSREYEEVSRRFQRNATLPGFRKGKVPRHLVVQSFGDRIQDEVVKRLVEDAYRNALRETNLEPVTYPVIDKVDFNLGEPLQIIAVVEVKPEIEFVDYKGAQLNRPGTEVTDEDVEKALDALRDRHAQYNPLEGREAMASDMVIVNQVARDETGLRIPKGSGNELAVPVGHERTRPEFEEALNGVTAGEKRDVVVQFADDDPDPAFAGKKVTFSLDVIEIRIKEVPDLDDEFAKMVGDFENLEELRTVARADLERQAVRRSEQEVRGQLLAHLIERNPFDLPQSMVERYLDQIVDSASRQAQQNRQDAARFDPDVVRNQNRPVAEQLLRKGLLFEAIQKAETIEVTEEEMDDRIERAAQANNLPARKMRVSLEKEGKLSRLHDDLLEEKTFQALIDMAEVKDAS